MAVVTTLVGNSSNIVLITIQAIILIPLYIHTIGPKLYGAWLGSGDVFRWLQAIDLAIPLMVQRIGIAHGLKHREAIAEYFVAGSIILSLVVLFITLVTFGISGNIPQWMGLEGAEAQTLKSCFELGALANVFQMLSGCAFGLSLGVQNTFFLCATRTLSTLVGLAVSLWLVLTGWGLWSLAIGMFVRSIAGFVGSAVFTIRYFHTEPCGISIRIRSQVVKEFVLVSPMMALGSLGYAIMNQSESVLVAIFLRPELATIVTITRKAAEFAQSFIDMIGSSTYGSVAHLAASNQREKTLRVFAEINSLRLSTAVAFSSAYMAVNGSLISLWVGSDMYGGATLTILMALRLIVVGQSYLLNYLYRAIGSVMRGSVILFAECIFRLPLMILLMSFMGLSGLPLAGIITAMPFGLLNYRLAFNHASTYAYIPDLFSLSVWVLRLICFSVGVLCCLTLSLNKFLYIIAVGFLLTISPTLIMIYIDPLLDDICNLIRATLRKYPIRPC